MDTGTNRATRRWAERLGLMILGPLVFVALAEGLLRLLGIGALDLVSDPARGFVDPPPIFESRRGTDGSPVLEMRPAETAFMGRLQFNPVRVPLAKTEGELRIVVLGGSLPYGWPYDDTVSFPRLLEAGLASATRGLDARVVNLGAPGYGTRRLRLLTDQVIRLAPDVVVIASGNNEFVEEAFRLETMAAMNGPMRGWLSLRRHSHFIRAFHSVLAPLRRGSADGGEQGLGGVAARSRDAIIARHEENLVAMSDAYREAGARVYLATVPANLADCPPVARDAPGERLGPEDPAAARTYRGALEARDEDPARAEATLATLLTSHPRSAQLWYEYARTLHASGRTEQARTAYVRALDLDQWPLRTSTPLNENVRRVAAARGVPVIDLVTDMARASPDGIPGDALFLDNCHPTRRGAIVLGLAVARRLVEDDVVAPGERWEEAFVAAARAHLRTAGVDAEAEARALGFLRYYFSRLNPAPGRVEQIDQRLRALGGED